MGAARIDLDRPAVAWTVVGLLAIVSAATFALGAPGLYATAPWMGLASWSGVLVVIYLDGAVLVHTSCAFLARARGVTGWPAWRPWCYVGGFTVLSATAQSVHAWTSGPGDVRGIVGAVAAALIPAALIAGTHEVAAHLITPHAAPARTHDTPPRTRTTPDTDRDARIVQLVRDGHTRTDAARAVGVHHSTVSRVLARAGVAA